MTFFITVLFISLYYVVGQNVDHPRFEYLGSSISDNFEEWRYYASSFPGIWCSAIQDCIDTFGPAGHLVSIETEEEALWINEWLERRGSGGATYWTSGIYVNINSDWMWASGFGKYVNFTAWNSGEPVSLPNNHHRIVLVHRNQFTSGWSAKYDSEIFRYICEVRVRK
ncbi:C-type lectin domain family 4 member K [Folsomia candida]|uniref:C-type lectin domain family 4 member K n=1 Tax=Folsomia candida TaxID=158441 RepID=A0A226D4W3_FOLCA|nr:C-type lectin domain family 4 member K [Folsomia candida]